MDRVELWPRLIGMFGCLCMTACAGMSRSSGWSRQPGSAGGSGSASSDAGDAGAERSQAGQAQADPVVAPPSAADLAEFPDVEISLVPPTLDPSSEQGVRFGKTSRDDVVDQFGMPKDMQEEGVGTSFIYRASDKFPGFRQVTFHFDEDGLLAQVDTFPSSTIGRPQVEDSYQAPAAVKTVAGGFEVMVYPKLGMLVYLKAGQVHSVRLAPKK